MPEFYQLKHSDKIGLVVQEDRLLVPADEYQQIQLAIAQEEFQKFIADR